MKPAELARFVDATILRPEATEEEVTGTCEEAAAFECAAAVVLPLHLDLCVRILAGSETKPCTAAAFPSGGATRRVLEAEVSDALERGAGEVDMVMPVGLFRGGRRGEVVEQVHAAALLVEEAGGLLKVIIEAGFLTDEEIVAAARLVADGGAHFVKTSTGVYAGGATPEQVRLIRSAVPASVGVKASGGISTYQRALEMVDAGANRIGTSSTRRILRPEGE